MAMDPMLAAAQEQVHAAWVQAYGAIGGIVAAILVPVGVYFGQRRADNFKMRTLARDHALVLCRPINDWRQQFIDHRRQMLTQGPMGSGLAIRTMVSMGMLSQLPKPLREQMGRIHELGEAARPVQNLVARFHELGRANQYLDTYLDPTQTEAQRASCRLMLERQLKEFFAALDKADESLVRLLRK